MRRRRAATSGSVSRSSNPLTAALPRRCPPLRHAHVRVVDRDRQRRTDEASRSRCRRTVCRIIRRLVVRLCRAVGSPELRSGPRCRRAPYLGSIPWPKPSRSCRQSKRFFAGLKCGRSHGTRPARRAPGRHPKDRADAATIARPCGGKERGHGGRAARRRSRPPACRRATAGAARRRRSRDSRQARRGRRRARGADRSRAPRAPAPAMSPRAI